MEKTINDFELSIGSNLKIRGINDSSKLTYEKNCRITTYNTDTLNKINEFRYSVVIIENRLCYHEGISGGSNSSITGKANLLIEKVNDGWVVSEYVQSK